MGIQVQNLAWAVWFSRFWGKGMNSTVLSPTMVNNRLDEALQLWYGNSLGKGKL